ncbi:MAG: 3-isopropylmalate dehydratase [Planktomarina sp.]|jgi:3-isopropylmalate/(R)-2-methylmalate dehydratase small subunit|nr:3-isopropylmalate dehydratase [Planktomarina sp.]
MSGQIFLLGDDINTDQLAPGRFMHNGIKVLSAHCLEQVRPGFAVDVRPGDLIVAGQNFGAGSSREQAAGALCHLGLAAVIAKSFAGIFYRNAINLGLPALVATDTSAITDAMKADLDIENAQLHLETKNIVELERLPKNLADILSAGGLVPFLKARFVDEKRKIL